MVQNVSRSLAAENKILVLWKASNYSSVQLNFSDKIQCLHESPLMLFWLIWIILVIIRYSHIKAEWVAFESSKYFLHQHVMWMMNRNMYYKKCYFFYNISQKVKGRKDQGCTTLISILHSINSLNHYSLQLPVVMIWKYVATCRWHISLIYIFNRQLKVTHTI